MLWCLLLQDLRFRSAKKPLTFSAAAASPVLGAARGFHAPPPLLPPQLLKLRLEGCNLTELPPPLTRLTCLEDLVLSDNNLQAARLTVRGGGNPPPRPLPSDSHGTKSPSHNKKSPSHPLPRRCCPA
jgi:hypothetical protein